MKQITTDVLFEEIAGRDGVVGLITLNRPTVLNSLNHDMIIAMFQQLSAWKVNKQIKAVIIQGAPGRAFCAGGDLRLTFERMKSQDPKMTDFFREEYQLNSLIYHYPKPYIALLNGITMGGGVGVSIHGSHRVATDNLLFAMPETGIGFFPDVGGTYFLPRLRDHLGFYLGLTGARITCDDCVAIGIATHKVLPEMLPSLIEEIAKHSFTADANQTINNIISQFQIESLPSSLVTHEKEIAQCFSLDSITSILYALHQSNNSLCQQAAAAMLKKSPMSLMVTLEALKNGKQLDFDACMKQEYRLVTRFLLSHDFLEGIRAVIIDKDQSPRWQPADVAEIEKAEITPYFSPLAVELE